MIKKGYFVEKKEEKSDVDSPFINMVNDNNRQIELDELEDLLDEYAEYEEKRKHNKNVSKMVRKFNNPWFRIKDAIQYCRDKVKKIINTRSRFHNDKGQDR